MAYFGEQEEHHLRPSVLSLASTIHIVEVADPRDLLSKSKLGRFKAASPDKHITVN